MIDGQLMGTFAQSEQLRPVGHCSHVVIFVKIYCLHVANNICAATPWSYHLTFLLKLHKYMKWQLLKYEVHTNNSMVNQGKAGFIALNSKLTLILGEIYKITNVLQYFELICQNVPGNDVQ